MDDNTKIYLGEKAAEIIAHGVDEEIKKRATNYSLCADGDGIRIDCGFGGKIFSSDLDYSTEEQLTGKRWIDGKPIYQKTIKYEGVLQTNVCIYQDDNIAEIINVFNKYFYDTNFSVWNSEISGIYQTNIINRGNRLYGDIASAYDNRITKSRCTIQYTKTTDTELSPVSLPKIKSIHNYSTEEQIVGTWIDGKPIYEKVILYDTTLSNNNWIEIPELIDDKNNIINVFAMHDGSYNPLMGNIDKKASNYVRVWNMRNTIYYSKYIVIQYTKTTD